MKFIFQTSDKLNERIERYARRKELSKAAIARLALSNYLESEEGDTDDSNS